MIFRRENTRNGQNRAEDRGRRHGDRRAAAGDAQQRARAERPVVARRQGARRTSRRATRRGISPKTSSGWCRPKAAASRASSPPRSTAPSAVLVGRRRPVDRVRRECARARRGRSGSSVATGAVTPVAGGDWSGRMESVSADGKRGVAVISTPDAPGEVHADRSHDRQDDADHARQPEGGGALARRSSRRSTWKSKDGLEVEGMLWLPADYKPGTKLPLLLSVHGGPAGAWDVSFRGINHVYTSLGWAVLEPNVRGSSSYGDALLRGNMKDIGGGDYQDLMTGVDKLIADGIADPGPPGDPRLELRRHPRRVDHYTNFTIQSGIVGGHGRRTGRLNMRWGSTTTSGSGISAARRGKAPTAYRRQSSVHPYREGDDADSAVARRARYDRYDRPEHDVLPGAEGPRRADAVHPFPARAARVPRAAPRADPRHGRNQLADEIRARHRLEGAGTKGRRRRTTRKTTSRARRAASSVVGRGRPLRPSRRG